MPPRPNVAVVECDSSPNREDLEQRNIETAYRLGKIHAIYAIGGDVSEEDLFFSHRNTPVAQSLDLTKARWKVIKPRVRVKMGRREISGAEYLWRSAQFNAIGIWRRTNEGMPYHAPMP